MNVNVTKIDRLSNGMVQFYNGSDVVDSFSITSSVSVGFENNLAKTIVFSNSVKTLSFNVFNLTTLYGATSSKIYASGIDPSDTGTAYISRLYDIYGFLISDVVQGCCPGPTFVGGVVAAYPDYFSFPAVGTPSVIYIDESTGIAYYWDAGAYHELVSGTAPTPLGYYGAWQDNVTQTAAVSNTGYAMIFRTIDLANGISVVTNGSNLTRITFAHTGVYNLQFSSQFQNTNTADEDVTIWLRLNGVDVPGSAGFISVPSKHGAVNGHTVESWNYLLNVVGGQYYELVWSTSSAANVTMQFYAAGSPPPSAASVILTVTQQAGIMAGTGITAINSLTGDVQTLATGTTGTDFGISSTGTTHTFNLPTASATNRGALSSTDWTTFNNKQNALGYTPVPETRTLTINGTTQDLSANRTFTITTNVGTVTSVAALTLGTTGTDLSSTVANGTSTPVITLNVPTASATNRGALSSTDWSTFNGKFTLPSLTSGSVLFSNGTTIAQDNANLFWDDTNNRLGIGTASPAYALDVATDIRALRLYTNIIRDSNINAYISNTVTNAATTDISIGNATAASITLTSKAAGKFVFTTGNVLIGTTTDAGFKLDVNGTARVNSTGDALTLSPGSSSNALIINNGGYVRFTSGANSYIRGFSTNFQIMDAAFTTRFSLSWGGSTSYFNTTGNFVFGATTANASSMLQIDSTTQGFLPPRMTTTQKNAIATPAAGLVVYDTTLGKLCVRGASAWETITSA